MFMDEKLYVEKEAGYMQGVEHTFMFLAEQRIRVPWS